VTKPLFISQKNRYGQYFTPAIVADYMVSLSHTSSDARVLEPSSGEGVFIHALSQKGYKNICAYEIDSRLCNDFYVLNESFVTANVEQTFDLIIGNPPYIRWKNLEEKLKKELLNHPLWKKYFNSLCDYSYIFILKSIELLKEGGELIFITSEYWLNTKHSLALRNYMVNHGYFEQIIHFNETPIFEKATVSTIIFKYIKTQKRESSTIKFTKYYANCKLTRKILENIHDRVPQKDTLYLEIDQFEEDNRWLLASNEVKKELKLFERGCQMQLQKQTSLFDFEATKYRTIGDVCDIGNGMVSGLDKAFQIHHIKHLNENEKGSLLKVVKAKDLEPYVYKNTTNYIYLNALANEAELQEKFPNFYHHFVQFKDKLNKRYQYNRDIPYWEWVFLRNFNLFSKDEPRIFVPCKERISNKDYFRFAFVKNKIYPTQDVTALFKKEGIKESIYYILALLNNKRVFEWLTINGVLKGNIVEFSQKPIASIPFRAIDWENKNEVALHDEIVALCKKQIDTNSYLVPLNNTIDKLFE